MSTKPSSTVTSIRTRGCVFRKGGTIAGNTVRATFAGAFSRSLPEGWLLAACAVSTAASFSAIAGESLAKRRVPASVSAMPQVALTWLLARSPNLLLIPGTSSTPHLAENCGAAELTLTGEAKAPLDALAG